MAQSEDVLWQILRNMRGHTAGWTFMMGSESKQNEVQNGYAVGGLKSLLLLKFLPTDIEDTIYFMKYRGYLLVHGQGMAMPEIAYSLTDKAIEVADSNKLPDDERKAFAESLWKVEPKIYGVGPNMKAWKKLFKNLFRRGTAK